MFKIKTDKSVLVEPTEAVNASASPQPSFTAKKSRYIKVAPDGIITFDICYKADDTPGRRGKTPFKHEVRVGLLNPNSLLVSSSAPSPDSKFKVWNYEYNFIINGVSFSVVVNKINALTSRLPDSKTVNDAYTKAHPRGESLSADCMADYTAKAQSCVIDSTSRAGIELNLVDPSSGGVTVHITSLVIIFGDGDTIGRYNWFTQELESVMVSPYVIHSCLGSLLSAMQSCQPKSVAYIEVKISSFSTVEWIEEKADSKKLDCLEQVKYRFTSIHTGTSAGAIQHMEKGLAFSVAFDGTENVTRRVLVYTVFQDSTTAKSSDGCFALAKQIGESITLKAAIPFVFKPCFRRDAFYYCEADISAEGLKPTAARKKAAI